VVSKQKRKTSRPSISNFLNFKAGAVNEQTSKPGEEGNEKWPKKASHKMDSGSVGEYASPTSALESTDAGPTVTKRGEPAGFAADLPLRGIFYLTKSLQISLQATSKTAESNPKRRTP